MNVSKWLLRDTLARLSTVSLSRQMFGRMRRVRRRGFAATVKRGDDVRYAGERWIVSRRSNRFLWLHEPLDGRQKTGATVTVKLPERCA